MESKKFTMDLAGRELTLEFGKYCEQAAGSVWVHLGDTVVTSGYSTVFPEGIMVGTVDDMQDSHDGLSYLLKVKLATDFGKVNAVRVVERSGQLEQLELERRVGEEN